MNFEKQAVREIYRKRNGLGFLNAAPSVDATFYASSPTSAELTIPADRWSSQIP